MSEVIGMKRNPHRERHSDDSRLHVITGASTWQHTASMTAVMGPNLHSKRCKIM